VFLVGGGGDVENLKPYVSYIRYGRHVVKVTADKDKGRKAYELVWSTKWPGPRRAGPENIMTKG
jgi:hypothetical protein